MISIAIVEDEDSCAKQMEEYLARYAAESGEEFETVRFCDGDEILENYRAQYDIILMDVQMKFMDGMTAADCGKLGYKIVTFPVSCLFAQTAALMSMLKYMKEHETDEGYAGDMMEFAEYLKFVNVDHYKELGDKYLRG